MFFSILLCCLLTKKAIEYISELNMNNLPINVFLRASDLYENVRLKINYIRHYLI